MTMKMIGYYNHCAVCGHVAAIHNEGGRVNSIAVGGGPVEPHAFVMRDDERMMASATPMWPDFWKLEDRVKDLERSVMLLGRGQQGH